MKIAAFKIEEWMNRYCPRAEYDLTTTCIAPLSINELPYSKEIFNVKLGYGDIEGSLRLKTAIKSLYENQETENITVTHGAIGANQLVFLSLLEKGDEVVSIVPAYQQHYSIPESLGCRVKLYFLKEENKWLPDLEELDRVITSKTKLLCLNNPNNPTGSVMPDWMLEEIESSDDEGLVIPVLKFEDIKKEKTKGLFNTTVKYSRDNYPKVANYDKNIQKHVDTIIEAAKQGIHYATFDINDSNDRLSYGKDSKETNTYNIEYRKMNQNGESQNLNLGTFQIREVIG